MTSKKRQSVDFGETWNIQTSLSVTEDKYDRIFHNWDNPLKCSRRNNKIPCSICEKLRNNEVVTKADKEYSALLVLLLPGSTFDNVDNFPYLGVIDLQDIVYNEIYIKYMNNELIVEDSIHYIDSDVLLNVYSLKVYKLNYR